MSDMHTNLIAIRDLLRTTPLEAFSELPADSVRLAIDLLIALQAADNTTSDHKLLSANERDLADRGLITEACKAIRHRTGCFMSEAKDYVDRYLTTVAGKL